MSPLPFLSPRKPVDDPAPHSEPESDSQGADSHGTDSQNIDDSVFELVPPRPAEDAAPALEPAEEEAPYKPQPSGRGVHSIGITDLSRLAIDNEGRLYWDGKPVEVRRRVMMSRAQVIGASIVSLFLLIGAVGAAIHGSAAALDWACRLGWTTHYCTMPDNNPPPPDIPA